MSPNTNLQDTLAALQKVSQQLEKLSKLKLEQASKEVAKYASLVEREAKKRGR